MKIETTYTHKGWFFLCPVYLNAEQSEGMDVTARHHFLDWWFDLNAGFFDFIASFSESEEPFPFKVTGKLEKPITISCEVDE